MYFKSVDGDDDMTLMGFKYTNRQEEFEYVIFDKEICKISPDEDGGSRYTFQVYTEDIPKLVKALQAAYDQYRKGV